MHIYAWIEFVYCIWKCEISENYYYLLIIDLLTYKFSEELGAIKKSLNEKI